MNPNEEYRWIFASWSPSTNPTNMGYDDIKLIAVADENLALNGASEGWNILAVISSSIYRIWIRRCVVSVLYIALLSREKTNFSILCFH
jgi:hypothetical protein